MCSSDLEGFRYQGLIDIFDGGPSVACQRDDIRTVRDAEPRMVRIGSDIAADEALISSGRLEAFRAVRAPVAINSETATLSREVADVLGVRNGDLIRIKG